MDRAKVEQFLRAVDSSFPVPLSAKQDLNEFAAKLCGKGTICAEMEEERIISMAAGYTDNLVGSMAYISVVATLPEAQGKGRASKLVREFIGICEQKHIDAVHLYAAASNTAAIRMYEKIGFVPLRLEEEPRPDDAHLVYCLKK